MTETGKLYTLQEVADYLRVSRQTIYNWVGAGKIKASKCGKEYRITEQDLQDFMKKGRNI